MWLIVVSKCVFRKEPQSEKGFLPRERYGWATTDGGTRHPASQLPQGFSVMPTETRRAGNSMKSL